MPNILGWSKKFIHNVLWKNPNGLFGQPNRIHSGLLRTEYISVCPYGVYTVCAHVYTHLSSYSTVRDLVSHQGFGWVLFLGKGLAWGRQHGSFLRYQQIFVQFKWLCRNGQGLGYKHWAWAFPSGLGFGGIHVDLGILGEGQVESKFGKG